MKIFSDSLLIDALHKSETADLLSYERYYTVTGCGEKGKHNDHKHSKRTGKRADPADEEEPRQGRGGRFYRGRTAHGGRAYRGSRMEGADRPDLSVRELLGET